MQRNHLRAPRDIALGVLLVLSSKQRLLQYLRIDFSKLPGMTIAINLVQPMRLVQTSLVRWTLKASPMNAAGNKNQKWLQTPKLSTMIAKRVIMA